MTNKSDSDRILILEWLLNPNTWIVMDRLEKLQEWQERFEKKFDEFVKCMPDKFADKWVENWVKWVVTLIVWAVITSVIYLVVK